MITKRNWTPFKESSQYSKDIQKLVRAMREIPFGGAVTHSDIDRIVGRDLEDRERCIVFSRTTDALILDYGMNFEKRQGILGYVRVADRDIPELDFGFLTHKVPEDMLKERGWDVEN